MTVLIADGVVPSNEGRGYVLRRLIRRAVRHGWLLGYEDLLMPRLASATAEALGDAYPEVVDNYDLIIRVVSQEERRFLRTLESGYSILQGEMDRLEAGPEPARRGGVPAARHLRVPHRVGPGDLRGAAGGGRPAGLRPADGRPARAGPEGLEGRGGGGGGRPLPGGAGRDRNLRVRRLRPRAGRCTGAGHPPRRRGGLGGPQRRPGGGVPGPDAVLRGGGRPGGGHREHRQRHRRTGDLRHPPPGGGTVLPPRPGEERLGGDRDRRSARESTRRAARASARATPPPTSSTGRCARAWEITSARPGRWSPTGGCASTSPTTRGSEARSCPRSRRWPTAR